MCWYFFQTDLTISINRMIEVCLSTAGHFLGYIQI